MIETWFDEPYKEYFYTREPLARFVDMGDISDQLRLRTDLKCKSFDWFMKEVAYDIFDKYPPLPPNRIWGELKNLANDFCLDTHGRHPPEKVRRRRFPTKNYYLYSEKMSEIATSAYYISIIPPTVRSSNGYDRK